MLRRVVGYQNKEVASESDGGFTFLISTLPSVGADLTQTKLRDFKVTPPEGGLTADISVYLTTFTPAGKRDEEYLYIDDALIEQGVGGVETPGWYTKKSVDDYEPVSADDAIIEFGRGVDIQSDCGATITFSGEVLGESKTFDINSESQGGFTFTGNCSPADVFLKDIAITPPEGGLTADISVYVTTFTSAGKRDQEYLYIDDALIEQGVGGVEEPGWYTKKSVDDYEPVSAGMEVIASGRMFDIQSDCGAKITIPSAIK